MKSSTPGELSVSTYTLIIINIFEPASVSVQLVTQDNMTEYGDQKLSLTRCYFLYCACGL